MKNQIDSSANDGDKKIVQSYVEYRLMHNKILKKFLTALLMQ
ncbi:hypothetical protein CLV59_102372 [Chitinophaga dinghuensis]|uniref:Uncharacterized protein n=1 Tax=Chitinophaga dinghuensis TaxID=1539050 RepID=A0A327W595_9BACT|nr:hypothetical protein CLV59_102372 [Chitinophaga dinghuensis]